MRIPYIVHLLIDNDVDVHTRSKGCSGRVIHDGKIIYEVVL
jgi:hypothetical protein